LPGDFRIQELRYVRNAMAARRNHHVAAIRHPPAVETRAAAHPARERRHLGPGKTMQKWTARSGGLWLFLMAITGTAGGAAAADASEDYLQLEQAVLDGRDIRMTLDLSACLMHGTELSGPPIRGSVRFDAVMIQSDRSIALSMTHFTVRNDGTPVNEFLSFKVQPSGKVDARSRFFNAATYSAFQDSEFDCDLGRGTAFHW
jgi:hypothetical protein